MDEDNFDLHGLEDLEALEYIERRNRYVPSQRNNDLDELDNVDFRKRYRFDKETIEDIVNILRPQLESSTTQNQAITPEENVLAAIRFFAFGNHQISVGDLQQMSQPSASRAINKVATLLAEMSSSYICLPETEAERVEISKTFYRKFDFPNVYGALDCTLVKLENPGGINAERFRSRKGYFALNVQTLSDPNLLIRNIVARWPGSAHDSTIFDHSYLRAHLERDVPRKYHVLGDSGYPLRSYLMTPILNPTNASEWRYNSAQIRARNVVERQYGVWKKRFYGIACPMRCRLENAKKIVVATAVLHNIAILRGDILEDDVVPDNITDDINLTTTTDGISKRNAIISAYFN